MTASGPGQLGYQWKYNNGNLAEGGRISGVASSNLVLTSVLTNDSGSYTVVVTNAYGAVTSSPALLTVVPPPTNGATVVFDNTTTDTGQWIWNPETGNQITLATNRGERILTECIIGILANNDVTNSHMAQLRLYRNDGPTNSPGTLLYAGSPVPVPRANTFDLRFPLDSVLVPNKFTWTLRLTGDTINFPLLRTFGPPTIGTEDSTNAWLGGGTWSQFNWGLSVPATWKARFSAAQAPIPFFANATASRIVRPGSNVSFQASASGPPPLAFQWLLNGSNLNNSARLSGAGTTNLAVGSVQPSDAGLYTLAAINSAGTRSNVVSSLSVLPDPWWDADIGGLAFPGWASYNAGVWTMQADGADIYYAVDGFHFVYQTLTGDGEIVARVTSQQNTHPWAKAGVMMRESLAPFSKHAMMIVTPGNGTGFEPRLPKGAYTADKLRCAMEGEVFSLVDCNDPSFAYGKGWAEFSGDIDGDGHNKGLRLARAVSTHLEYLARAIRRLLAAAWKEVWVVSDHGWLLMPGGLPKVELPAKLTETKWGRCAVLKDASGDQDMLVLPWSFDPAVRVALAPGISAFSSGREYDHGGLSLQESVVPFLRVQRKDAVAGLPRFLSVSWNTRKTICSVTAGDAAGLMLSLERLGTAIGEAEGIGADGKARVIFEEVDDLLGEQVLMVLYRDGLKVAEERLIFGEVWNGA